MYNGIGLQTARGSGTNGYVQRNMSFIRRHKDKVDYKSEADILKLEAQLNKGANEDILEHARKRKVELKCMEMQELMEEQGYTTEEIETKVSTFRKMLMAKEGVSERTIETDEMGRPSAKETHQVAEAKKAKNDQLRAALGISDQYVVGSALDSDRKAKEEAAKAAAMAQQNYSIVRSGSSSRSQSPEHKKKKKKKEKDSNRRSRSRSESPEIKEKKKKKNKKQKKDEYV